MTDLTTLDDHPFAHEREHPLPDTSYRRLPQGILANLEWRQTLGGVALIAGLVAILVAWFGSSGTLDPGKQMPYLVSGGIGGAALIAVGMTLFLSLEHARDREALGRLLDRLDQLEHRLDPIGDNDAPASRSRNGRRATQTSTAGTGR